MMLLDKRLFIRLFPSFIFATILGTLFHEWGHYIVAEALGYDAVIHYAFTSYTSAPVVRQPTDSFWISLGGPLQTLMTGTIGLIMMVVQRKSFREATTLSTQQWFLVLITLCWLRPAANLVTWIGGYFINGRFSPRGDEIVLAGFLHLPIWSVLVVTALMGLLVLTIVVIKFIPAKQRITFLCAGLTGGIAGYVLWLKCLGRFILP
jgi:hypothetical protein